LHHFRDAAEDRQIQSMITYINNLETELKSLISGQTQTASLFNNHEVSSDTVLDGETSSYIARYLEIATGVTLEIGYNADLEVG